MSTVSVVIEIAVFLAVCLVVFVLANRMEARKSLSRRLGGEQAKPEATVAARRANLVRAQAPKNPLLAWVQKNTLQDPKERSNIRRDLTLAGFESPAAPAIYVVVRFVLAATLPIVFIFMQRYSAKPMTGLTPIFCILGLTGLGLLGPRSFIDNRANARKGKLQDEFPDALDLMVVCVESGLGLEGALLRVGQETARSHPRVSMEFEMVSQELRVGRTRADALRNMAERTQVDSVKAFVTLLIQTDSLGGSIAQALRTYSDEMRRHRMLRAEEKAMRLPVLMTIPLVLFILPVIVMTVMLPAIIEVRRNFMPAMGGK